MTWFDTPALETVVMWGGAFTIVAGVVGALWRLGRAASRTGARMNTFMDDWYGEPSRPGVVERPGMMQRVSVMEDRLRRVEHELYPNSGDSLRDAVDQANRRLARLCGSECDDPEHQQPPPPPAGE
ncbi:hypothetical protein [Streptomyces sp. A5-4]|uniref:hypothetical protein n=1 Tax=Streptomyces sp. A5-4 TaxID=3384771 RepID=UPI003DA8BD12